MQTSRTSEFWGFVKMNMMDFFYNGLDTLPKPKNELEKSTLNELGEAYIISDEVIRSIDDLCETESDTRVLKVYVPKADVIMPICCFHYDKTNPTQACKSEFRNSLKSQGIKDEEISAAIESLYSTRMFPGENLQDQLARQAINYKTTRDQLRSQGEAFFRELYPVFQN